MKWQEAKAELLKDPETKREYEKFDLWYEIGKRWTDFKIWLKR